MTVAFARNASDRPDARPFTQFRKRLVNAIAASRIDPVERELRRHEPRLGAGRGEAFTMRFDRAELLPFHPLT